MQASAHMPGFFDLFVFRFFEIGSSYVVQFGLKLNLFVSASQVLGLLDDF